MFHGANVAGASPLRPVYFPSADFPAFAAIPALPEMWRARGSVGRSFAVHRI
jgi:hypothetical protein